MNTLRKLSALAVAGIFAAALPFAANADQLVQGTLSVQGNINQTQGTATFNGTAVNLLAPIVPTGGIAPAGGFTTSPRNVQACNSFAPSTAPAPTQPPLPEPSISRRHFVPCEHDGNEGVAVFNGTVASGNTRVALLSSTGAVLAQSASTASAGTAGFQLIPFTATYAAVGPASYFIGEMVDGTTVRPVTVTVGTCATGSQTGSYGAWVTFATPPTTFTTAVGPFSSLY